MTTQASDVALFNSGDPVRYIPRHAHGDINHPDCENGIVSSRNDEFVFVRYYARVNGKESAGLRATAQATYPADLVKT